MVDALELYLRELKPSNEFDTRKIKKIEEEFDKFNLESEDKNAVAVYYYTLANYQAVLKVLDIKDFEVLNVTSKFVSDYTNQEDYLRDNHALRAKTCRQAIKAIPEDTKRNKAGISQFYVNFLCLC